MLAIAFCLYVLFLCLRGCVVFRVIWLYSLYFGWVILRCVLGFCRLLLVVWVCGWCLLACCGCGFCDARTWFVFYVYWFYSSCSLVLQFTLVLVVGSFCGWVLVWFCCGVVLFLVLVVYVIVGAGCLFWVWGGVALCEFAGWCFWVW